MQRLCVSARWELLSTNPRSARNFQTEFGSLQAWRLRLNSQSSHICGPWGTWRWAEGAGGKSHMENLRCAVDAVSSSTSWLLLGIKSGIIVIAVVIIIDRMNLKALWILVVFICYVRGGFSRNYEANLKSNHLLQVRSSFFPFFSEGLMEFNWDSSCIRSSSVFYCMNFTKIGSSQCSMKDPCRFQVNVTHSS